MLFQLETAWLVSTVLTALRLGALTYATPLDAIGRIPVRVKVFLNLSLAALLVNALQLQVARLPENAVEFGLLGLYELVKGLVLVLGVHLSFGAFMLAGQLLDSQTGFAAANILNPTTSTPEPILGALLQLLGVALFFLMDFHHLMLQGIAYSFAAVPLGAGLEGFEIELALQQFGLMFSYGLMLAAPAVMGLLVVDIGVAMMSRTMPQINIYFVTLPLKIFLGLALTAISLRYLLPLIRAMFIDIFQYWDRVI